MQVDVNVRLLEVVRERESSRDLDGWVRQAVLEKLVADGVREFPPAPPSFSAERWRRRYVEDAIREKLRADPELTSSVQLSQVALL